MSIVQKLLLRIIDQLRAQGVEAEGDMQQVRQGRADFLPIIGPDIEEDETAPAGAEDLAAQCAGVSSLAVDIVNHIRGNLAGKASLQDPVFVQKLSKGGVLRGVAV